MLCCSTAGYGYDYLSLSVPPHCVLALGNTLDVKPVLSSMYAFCLLFFAGHYLVKQCGLDPQKLCLPCPAKKYLNKTNSSCVPCRTCSGMPRLSRRLACRRSHVASPPCRPSGAAPLLILCMCSDLQHVVMHQCTTSRDTVCGCKKGLHCANSECSHCAPCGVGEELLQDGMYF